MGISQKVMRKLWASSGGYCANPSCIKDLFPFFENGEVTNIGEFTHIIGRKKKEPRDKDDLPMTQRDEFDSIIVLCPSCHTLVDKNEKQFPALLFKEWKRNQGSGDADHYAFLIRTEFDCHKETEEVFSQMGVNIIWCEDRDDVPRQIMRVV